LTNAELIKALFLQKGNFDNDVTLKQLQIASEWDIIEKALQDYAFWFFIYNPRNPSKYDNRIEYILDLMNKKTKEMDDYHTFNKFYNDNFSCKNNKPDIVKIWLEIKQYFQTFEEWFNDNELFHYIGYLINCSKNDNAIIIIKNKATDKTKTEFKNYLKEQIKKQVDCVLNNLKHKKDKDQIKKVLLLFNIQTMQKSGMRFPFDKYKSIEQKYGCDIEHIRSQTDKIKMEEEERIDWIDVHLEYFEGTKDTPEESFYNSLIELKESKKIDVEKFNNVFDGVQKHFNEDEQLAEKDHISNFALLDAHTNRSYKNSFFPVKRKKIIENDEKGFFVPITTKNLFLKYYTKKMGEIMYWKDDDAKNYFEAIKLTLRDFLPRDKK